MSDDRDISDRKSPGFWFFTADFERDMQILPLAAQGLWIRMMCWASENEAHRGFLELPTGQPMNELDIAHRVGKPIKEIRAALYAMKRMGTFSEDDRGCIFSRRMARDTHISEVRRQAASKRASLVERAKHGQFAPAKPPANEEQKPAVSVIHSDSDSDSDSIVIQSSSISLNDKNGEKQKIVTTTDGQYANPKDELIALMCTTMGHQPEVRVVRDVCDRLEIRGMSIAQFIEDIRPRIPRLRQPPQEGFFLSQAKNGHEKVSMPETAAEKKARTGPCDKCQNTGFVQGEYCDCRMAKDLKRVAARKTETPQQQQKEAS